MASLFLTGAVQISRQALGELKVAAATSPEYFAAVDGFVTSWFGDLIMFLSLWALWYHTLAGIRHLIWDTGRGLEVEMAEKLGWGCIGGSVVLTLLTVLVI